MTLCDLSNAFSLQGNIKIKVFDAEGHEKETRCFLDEYDFNCTFSAANDLEEHEVVYMFATKSADGTPWMVIELKEEE